MKSKMKMNKFLILLLILLIILLFLVYYYKYLRKQQFESFYTKEYKNLKLELNQSENKYITYDLLECGTNREIWTPTYRPIGNVSFQNVVDKLNECPAGTRKKKFIFSINNKDYQDLKSKGTKHILVEIGYNVANDKKLKEYSISLK